MPCPQQTLSQSLWDEWMDGEHLIRACHVVSTQSTHRMYLFLSFPASLERERKGYHWLCMGLLPSLPTPPNRENDMIWITIVLYPQSRCRWATLKENLELRPPRVSSYSSLAGYWLNNTLALRPICKLKILHQEPLCSQSHLISKEGMLQLAIQKLFYILVTMHKN